MPKHLALSARNVLRCVARLGLMPPCSRWWKNFPWNDDAQFQVKGKVIAAGIIKPGEQAQVLLEEEGNETLAGES